MILIIIIVIIIWTFLASVIDMFNNKVADMRELGITESFKLKRQVLLSATEAAEMILRVDDIIR